MAKRKIFFGGNLVFLTPLERNDSRLIAKWINDPEITHYMFYGQLPKNGEQMEEMIMAQVNSPQNVVFLVCNEKSGEPIGFAGLYDIHLTARKAEFRILIGEKKFWGKGCGTEITELLTFYGFDRLNLHRIYLGVTSENRGAIRAYEKAGYQCEGALREDIYRNSRYYDSIKMAILRHEYYPNLYEKHCKKFKTRAR